MCVREGEDFLLSQRERTQFYLDARGRRARKAFMGEAALELRLER